MEGCAGRRAIAIGHFNCERQVDLVLALAHRLVQRALQREAVARATIRQFHRKHRHTISRPGDRLTIRAGRQGHWHTARGQGRHQAAVGERNRAQTIIARINRQRPGNRCRFLIRIRPIGQIVFIHTTRIHAQFRVIRIFAANRRLARRRWFRARRGHRDRWLWPIIGDLKGLRRRGRIAIPIRDRIGERIQQRRTIRMRLARVTGIGERPVRLNRQRAILRVDLNTNRTGLFCARLVGIGEGCHFSAIGPFRVIAHHITGDGVATLFQRQRRIIHRNRHVVDDRDVEGGAGRRAIAIGHFNCERQVDLVLALAHRLVQRALQREAVARATIRQFHRKHRHTISRPGDRLTIRAGRQGHWHTARGQGRHQAAVGERNRAQTIIARINRQRPGNRCRFLIRIRPIGQIVFIHTTRIHAQFRVIRIFAANRRLARRRWFRARRGHRDRWLWPIIGDLKGLRRRGRIAIPIRDRIGERIQQRRTIRMRLARVTGIGERPVRLYRQRAILRVDLNTNRTGLFCARLIGIGERCHFSAISPFRVVAHHIAGDRVATFFQRQRRIIHRNRHIIDDIDINRCIGGVAISIGHRHAKGQAGDDIRAIACRVINLTRQVKRPAKAVRFIPGHTDREDLRSIRHGGDRLTIRRDAVADRFTAGRQRHVFQCLRHRQGNRPKAIITGINANRATDRRCTALITARRDVPIFAAQVIFIHNTRRRIRARILNRHRRDIIIGHFDAQHRRILIAIPIGQRIGEVLEDRLRACNRIVTRREGIAAIGCNRQNAGIHRDRRARHRINRIAYGVARPIRILHRRHAGTIGTNRVIGINNIAADRLALFYRTRTVIHRNRNVIDDLNPEFMLEDQTIQSSRIKVIVGSGTVFRRSQNIEVQRNRVFRRRLRMIQRIDQLERIAGIRIQGNCKDRARRTKIIGRNCCQDTVILSEGNCIAR